MSNKNNINRLNISRRMFLGTAAGGAALSLLKPTAAFAKGHFDGSVLTDYVGRLCYNENPLGPSPEAMTAISESIDMGHRYPDWFAETLVGDLADFHNISSGKIIAGCGATEILRLIAMAFADPDGNVVCPYPSYAQFPADCSLLGASVIYSDLDENYRVDLDDMASRIDSHTTTVCITNPNNPTGPVLAASEIENFINSIPDNVVVIIDEAYHEFIHDESYQTAIELVRQNKNVVVIRTFSKVYGLAGIRIGYAVGKHNLIDDIKAYRLYASVSRPALDAACAALTDTQHVADTVALNDQAKQYCFNSLNLMELEYIPSETNYFMVDVGRDAGTVAAELSSRGIHVRTGWGMPHHLRVSTGTMEEMTSFITALDDILGYLGVDKPRAPHVTALDGNYPNPFNSATRISYTLANGGQVLLQIFNIRGQLVKTVVNGYKSAGHHAFDWNGRNDKGAPVASGSYFYRLTANDFMQTRRMILVK